MLVSCFRIFDLHWLKDNNIMYKVFGLGLIFFILKQVFLCYQGCSCLIKNRALNSNIKKYFEINKSCNMGKSSLIACVIYYASVILLQCLTVHLGSGSFVRWELKPWSWSFISHSKVSVVCVQSDIHLNQWFSTFYGPAPSIHYPGPLPPVTQTRFKTSPRLKCMFEPSQLKISCSDVS